ncbi:MAG: Holliday junction resolvase RuvX [Chloroflexi bacterium]|nr:Holliday junction resolvase RuvX [Chloroflexota bacterium]
MLAVDHGQKKIGLALSDETGMLARPLGIIPHISKILDAAQVAERAAAHDAGRIIVGVSYDEAGDPNDAGRRAMNFAEILRQQTDLPVELWDESLTTQDARAARIAAGAPRKKRAGHLDDVAAAVLLQNYLDTHTEE